MKYFKVLFKYKFFLLFNFLVCYPSIADNHNIYDTLEILKEDLKTLEKAVYSQSSDIITTSKTKLSSNDEDVLTRHLLKLSEICLLYTSPSPRDS